MRNKTQAITRTSIPYVKQFRKYVGSIAGCILFQQLDFWFSSKPDGFYKFLEKPQSEHPQYKDGDSWNEELEITPDEFRTAFDAIAIRYKSKKEYDSSPDKFQGKFYCSYYDRVARLTWYFRNHDLVDGFLDIVYKGLDATVFLETGIASSRNQDGQFLETGIASSRNWDQPLLETGIASSNLYTELTTDLTTNIRADDFFTIAPSSLNQENSFPAQTAPRIQETPNPQSPLSPLPPENKPKKVWADPMGDRFANKGPSRQKLTEPLTRDNEFLTYLFARLRKTKPYYKDLPDQQDLEPIRGFIRKCWLLGAEGDIRFAEMENYIKDYEKHKAAEAIATKQRQVEQQRFEQPAEDDSERVDVSEVLANLKRKKLLRNSQAA